MTQEQTPLADMRGCKSLHAYAVMLEKQNKELKDALSGVLDITYDSTGVAGYHQNGDIASWGEFGEIDHAVTLLESEVKDDRLQPNP